jgi:2'-5' RNA ligase
MGRSNPRANDCRSRDPRHDELRLFIALPVPDDAAHSVRDALGPLRDRFTTARWLDEPTLHVTLLFLGPTHHADVPRLRDAIDATAGLLPAYEARTTTGGGRVGHPRQGGLGVAWLNLDRGADEAAKLAVDLGARLGTGEGWPAKGHAAHITVARRATGDLVRALGEPGAFSPVSWIVDRIVLFASHLESSAARYEPLHVAPLSGPVADAEEPVNVGVPAAPPR